MSEASDAAKIAENSADISMRRPPRHGVTWKHEASAAQVWPSSPNKRISANHLELVTAFDRGEFSTVRGWLDWFAWLGTQPFMLNEMRTPVPTYEVLHSYPFLIAHGIALAVGHGSAVVATRAWARAHFFWNLVGIGMAPQKTVKNHHHGDGDGCILVGDGTPIYSMRGVSCAGMRGWNRSGKTLDGDFDHTTNPATAGIVAQGLGQPIPNSEWIQRDWMKGFLSRFPELRPWCLSSDEEQTAKQFAGNPASRELASKIRAWLLAGEKGYRVDRYESLDVATALLESRPSSTDPLMVEILEANGRTQLASLSDGIRSTDEPQRVEVMATAYRITRNGKSGSLDVPKPKGNVAYSFIAENGSVRLEVGGQPIPPEPGPTPPDPTPPPSGNGPLEYLGVTGAGEWLYGSKTKITLKEIHGDGGYPQRWVAK